MPIEGTPSNIPTPALLADDEPTAYRVINPQSVAPVLLLCDHASRRMPRALGDMGLDPVTLRCHLAWDIGAGPLTERLAAALCVPAVCAQYSRLVVDVNRELLDPSAFLEFGDGVVVHGNRSLNAAQKQARADEIYWVYHGGVRAEIERLRNAGVTPTVVAVHSFTPVLNGASRPWEIGVLWDTDRDTAERFLDGFRSAGFKVGDNEPYSGKAPADFTIDHHAEAAKLPHVGIEIRQDLIDSDRGVAVIGEVFEKLLAEIFGVAPVSANDDDCGSPPGHNASNG